MKFLVIRFSSIGDILLTSPVVRCLKQQVPGAEVQFLTKAAFRELVMHSPYVDKVHTIDDDPRPPTSRGETQVGTMTLGTVIPQLKQEGFDVVIDLHHNLRTARVKRALGVPAKSFRKLNFGKWLLVNFKRDHLPRAHIVDRYMSTVAHLGVKNDGQGLDLFIPQEKEIALGSLPETHRTGYIALCIGGGHHIQSGVTAGVVTSHS